MGLARPILREHATSCPSVASGRSDTAASGRPDAQLPDALSPLGPRSGTLPRRSLRERRKHQNHLRIPPGCRRSYRSRVGHLSCLTTRTDNDRGRARTMTLEGERRSGRAARTPRSCSRPDPLNSHFPFAPLPFPLGVQGQKIWPNAPSERSCSSPRRTGLCPCPWPSPSGGRTPRSAPGHRGPSRCSCPSQRC